MIAFSPVVETGWDTVLKEAKTANIPVILTDRPSTRRIPRCTRASSAPTLNEGKEAGDWVAKEYASATGR
ncbi:hypothetical protein GCM10018954_029420 [Kutzneria kofuensis]